MIDWYLAFSCLRSLAPETIGEALARFAGAPVTMSIGELEGNPRDYYYRSISIEGRRGDVSLSISITQNFMMPSDPDPVSDLNAVRFATPALSFPQMREIWHGLRDALGAIGCTDQTLERRAAPIIARMESAGETALAAELRAEVTAALVAHARTADRIELWSARADLEAVLEAYPETITHARFDDCHLRALPAALRRFPKLQMLYLTEPHVTGAVVRGWSLPHLHWLSFAGSSAVTRLTRDDVAGFPRLVDLGLDRTRLRELDAAILDVCPILGRASFEHTPLARNAEAVAALRARWPNVVLDVD